MRYVAFPLLDALVAGKRKPVWVRRVWRYPLVGVGSIPLKYAGDSLLRCGLTLRKFDLEPIVARALIGNEGSSRALIAKGLRPASASAEVKAK